MKIKLFGKDKKSAFPRRGIIMAVIAGILVAGLSGVPNTYIKEDNPYVVEAKSKKDKKKPVIKFNGKTKITVEKGKSVKIPKTTAKDNKDGNVTKKIKVTVKKGNKNFSKIAKAVKNNKNTKFTSTGTYKIKYTVSDKAGNKATKTRTIKVVNPKEKIPTTEKITTEVPTTEKITTETPTTEVPTEKEYPIYDYKVVDFSLDEDIMNKFDVLYDKVDDRDDYVDNSTKYGYDNITINIENDFSELYMFSDSPELKNNDFFKYLGKIKAFDENGKDISNNIVIVRSITYLVDPTTPTKGGRIFIYVEDEKGNAVYKWVWINLIDRAPVTDIKEIVESNDNIQLVSTNPIVYAEKRVKKNSLADRGKVLNLSKIY